MVSFRDLKKLFPILSECQRSLNTRLALFQCHQYGKYM